MNTLPRYSCDPRKSPNQSSMALRIWFPARALALAFLWIAVPNVSAVESQEQRVLFTSRDASGETTYAVSEERLLSTKKWSPETDPLPLSIADATAAARKSIAQARGKDLRVIQVELIASGGQEWRWFYRIRFYDVATASKAQGPDMHDAIVLFDGSVVAPSHSR